MPAPRVLMVVPRFGSIRSERRQRPCGVYRPNIDGRRWADHQRAMLPPSWDVRLVTRTPKSSRMTTSSGPTCDDRRHDGCSQPGYAADHRDVAARAARRRRRQVRTPDVEPACLQGGAFPVLGEAEGPQQVNRGVEAGAAEVSSGGAVQAGRPSAPIPRFDLLKVRPVSYSACILPRLSVQPAKFCDIISSTALAAHQDREQDACEPTRLHELGYRGTSIS